jgi:uncharacterized membrane protein YidH (DUF202 family)
MRTLGVVLVLLGLVGLLYGGFTWTRKEKVVDIGPVEVTADKHERLAIPPIAGGLLVVAGVGLLVLRRPK